MKLRIRFQILLAALHLLVATFTAWLAYYSVFGANTPMKPAYEFLAIALPLIFAMRYRQKGGYDLISGHSVEHCIENLSYAWVQVFLILAALLYATSSHQYVENEWLMAWLLLGWVGLIFASLAGNQALGSEFMKDEAFINIAIVGWGTEGKGLAEQLMQSAGTIYRIVGVFDDRAPSRLDKGQEASAGLLPVSGNTDDLLSLARVHTPDKIIVALPTIAETRIKGLIQKLHVIPTEISVYLYSLKDNPGDLIYQRLGDAPTLRWVRAPMSLVDAALKRGLELALILIALPILTPLMLLIALLVKLDSPGPVLFRQERGGYRSQRFIIYKFRTMHHAREEHMIQARPGDPRVTRIGRWLRRFSLDELPQILNVLRGELSLVGPRPHATEMDNEYDHLLGQYVSRTRVKPGLTGWAQVQGLRGVTDTPEKMQNRLDHDLFYIDNWSLWLDIKIILKTFRIVLEGENAH